MPIVFVHGVAVRREGDPDFQQVSRVTQGTQWEGVRAYLRQFLAPVLRPDAPQQVRIEQVYWGDLGAHVQLAGSTQPLPQPAALDRAGRADLLEEQMRSMLPARLWPELARVAWQVAEQTPPGQGWEALNEELLRQLLSASAEMVRELGQKLGGRLLGERAGGVANTVPQWLNRPLVGRPGKLVSKPLAPRWPLPNAALMPRQEGVRRAMSTVRRPIESFVPIFLGDVMAYLNHRGTPQAPGPIPLRVMQALIEAARAAPDEPLLVVTHSMGGQIMYDLLTAFLPVHAPGLRVSFWCACGSQVGLFKELGLFLEDLHGGGETLKQRVGYFWNVWSYSDLLSFPARGRVPGVHETSFAQTTASLRGDHIGYLRNKVFYELLAVKAGLYLQEGSRPAEGARA